jgi:hypothetical protein
MKEIASYRYENYDPNDKLYYWDEAGMLAALGSSQNHSWMTSIFTSTQNGNITSVDFWVPSSNAQYQIYVYDGNFGTQLLTSQNSSCSEAGLLFHPSQRTSAQGRGTAVHHCSKDNHAGIQLSDSRRDAYIIS